MDEDEALHVWRAKWEALADFANSITDHADDGDVSTFAELYDEEREAWQHVLDVRPT
jgi:hypothetical protein